MASAVQFTEEACVSSSSRRAPGLLGLVLLSLLMVCSAFASTDAGARPASGKLVVTLTGLPKSASARIVIDGPGKKVIKRKVRASKKLKLKKLRPGRYKIKVTRVKLRGRSGLIEKGAVAIPDRSRIVRTVHKGRKSRAKIRFGTIKNPVRYLKRSEIIGPLGPPEAPTEILLAPGSKVPVGRMVSAMPSVALPDGLLARVVSADTSEGSLKLRIERASIFEALPNASFRKPIRSDLSLVPASSAPRFKCEGIGPVEVGAPTLRDVALLGDWQTFQIKKGFINFDSRIPRKVDLRLEYTVDADLDIGVTAGAECKFPAMKIEKPFRVWFVPAWVKLEMIPKLTFKSSYAYEFVVGAKATNGFVGKASTLKDPIPSLEPVFKARPFGMKKGFKAEGLSLKAEIGINGSAGVGTADGVGASLAVKNKVVAEYQPNQRCAVDFAAGQFAAGVQLSDDKALSLNIGESLWSGQIWNWPRCFTDPASGVGTRISAGSFRSCAINGASKALCWGDGRYALFSFEENNSSGTPKVVKGLPTVRAISTGGLASCAIAVKGQVFCWGSPGESGLLGDGSDEQRKAPVKALGLPDAKAVSVGDDHACAVRKSGQVYCWGTNYEGQLGNGSTRPSARPVAVKGATDVVELALGDEHTCALGSDGRVSCWGARFLGGDQEGNFVSGLTPTKIPNLEDIKAIAVDGGTTCTVAASGEVLCWGDNQGGLANPKGFVGDVVSKPRKIEGISDAVSVGVGSNHACALGASGRVYCWGGNFNGQFGNGTKWYTDPLEERDRGPFTVSDLADAVALDVGHSHSCAVRRSGQVVCWGAGETGELGDGRFRDSLVPTVVKSLTVKP